MVVIFRSTISFLILWAPFLGHSWGSHFLITRAALQPILKTQPTVEVTSFDDFLNDISVANKETFNRNLRIRKDYKFSFTLKPRPEEVGHHIRPISIFSHYSDEPDWGMDKELFDKNNYPELWESQYSMMGGKKGTPSQAFRHMYWREFHWLSPLATFKLPIGFLFKPMGEGPDRAKIFIFLARQAKKTGHLYWQYRFIANALHYVEDITNPFHSTQTPTKKFIWMVLTGKYGGGFNSFIPAMTNLVSYYHFAFEDYVADILKNELDTNLNGPLVDALQTHPGRSVFDYEPGNIGQLVIDLAHYSSEDAAMVARAAIKFFPEITSSYATLNAAEVLTESWWKETWSRGEQDSEEKKHYFNTVEKMFRVMGHAIRSVVEQEISQ